MKFFFLLSILEKSSLENVLTANFQAGCSGLLPWTWTPPARPGPPPSLLVVSCKLDLIDLNGVCVAWEGGRSAARGDSTGLFCL